jgi:dihydroorotate dehydrogenase (fumarate)
MTTTLTTTYMGMQLPHPLVASAGPLTGRLESLCRLEDAGVAAVVLPSLFEEDVVSAAEEAQRLYEPPDGFSAESESFLPELPAAPTMVERHLQFVSDAKAALAIPVIASLNGVSSGGWVRYATELEAAGADALELNLYFVAADATRSGGEVEAQYVELVRAVRAAVSVPVAVKLSPFFSATAHSARQLAAAGADALVLFNRFYQPDIDLETLDVLPTISLSSSADLRLPLRWVAILNGQVPCSLALSSGVHTAEDAVKAILAGANVVMTTSALLRHGPKHLHVLLDGIEQWLEGHEYESVEQACGSVSRRAVADPDRYERANYVEILHRYTRHFSEQPLA